MALHRQLFIPPPFVHLPRMDLSTCTSFGHRGFSIIVGGLGWDNSPRVAFTQGCAVLCWPSSPSDPSGKVLDNWVLATGLGSAPR